MPRAATLADHVAARDAELIPFFAGQVIRHADGTTEDARAAYLATLAERAAAYAAHIAGMQIDPDVPAWALAMGRLHGPWVRVHHQIADWITALLIARYGEAVEFWPVAFTADDRRRAHEMLTMTGKWPRGVHFLEQTVEG